jgi:hypothetical protein
MDSTGSEKHAHASTYRPGSQAVAPLTIQTCSRQSNQAGLMYHDSRDLGDGVGDRPMCIKGMRRDVDAMSITFIRRGSTYQDLKRGWSETPMPSGQGPARSHPHRQPTSNLSLQAGRWYRLLWCRSDKFQAGCRGMGERQLDTMEGISRMWIYDRGCGGSDTNSQEIRSVRANPCSASGTTDRGGAPVRDT